MKNNKSGIISTVFSTLGLILIACFYLFQVEEVWIFAIGAIFYLLGVYFSIMSFTIKEKGNWKLAPIIVFGIYLIGILLSFVSLIFIGEA